MEDRTASKADGLLEWLCLAAIITVAAVVVPAWAYRRLFCRVPDLLRSGSGQWRGCAYHGLCLLLAVVLTAGSWRRSGVRIGTLRPHGWKVLIICGLPPVLTAALYPLLPWRPFAGESISMWLISPLAQDLIFIGYLYGRFERVLPGLIHRRVPIGRALVVTAAYFSAWHLQNFGQFPAVFVAMQLVYTFVGCIFTGLTRQWTGSILYLVLSHMAANCVAWCMS